MAVPRENGVQTWADSLPVWIRAIAIVGIPGAIAIFLVWMSAMDLPAIRKGVENVEREVLYNRKLIEQQNIRADANFRLLQRICSNTARNDIERQRCFD